MSSLIDLNNAHLVRFERLLKAIQNNEEEASVFLLEDFPELARMRHETNMNSALHLAAQNDMLELCKLLIKAGADVNAKNFLKSTPLHYAPKRIAELLIENGACESQNSYGLTQLHFAFGQKFYDKAEMLISKGFSPNAKEEAGLQPIHYAAGSDDPHAAILICALVSVGADPNAQDDENQTPLHYAHSPEAVSALIDAGAVEKPDSRGNTALHGHVGFKGLLTSAIQLVKAGFDLDSVNLKGETPLHIAAALGRPEAIFELVKAGADSSKLNDKGLSPPLVAISQGTWQAFRVFLDLGVDVDLEKATAVASSDNAELLQNHLLKIKLENEPNFSTDHQKRKI